jgi:hypothetical protein
LTSRDHTKDTSATERPRKLLAQLLRDRARQSRTVVPATMAQRGVWFMQQRDPTTHAYHLSFCVRVMSAIEPASARLALRQLIDRHAVLRSTFRYAEGRLEMLVHGAGDAEFMEIDAAGWSIEEIQKGVERTLQRPFDLHNGPLLRLHLFSCRKMEHVFVLVLHHLICDGWSLAILLQEFMKYYQAEISGILPGIAPRTLDFPDVARQHQQWLASTACEKSKAYWLKRLGGGISRLSLPTSNSRLESTTIASAMCSFEIDETISAQLNAFARSRGVTLFSVLLAAYQILMMRLSGQSDIIVGVPMAGRTEPGYDGVVGHFVNLAAIRGDLSDDMSFQDFVDRTWRELQCAMENQNFPFLELIRLLRPAGRSERNPLFRTILNCLKAPPEHPLTCVLWRGAEVMQWGPLRVAHFPAETPEEQYDLSVRVVEAGQRLHVKLQYDCNLFDAQLIEHFGRCLTELLKSVTANPSRTLTRLDLLAPIDREQLLVVSNDTSADFPRNKGVHQLLAEQAARTPEATALAFRGSKLTYRELNRRANQLARYLQQQGVGRNDLVAVCAERSPELVIALIGTLKAGAA